MFPIWCNRTINRNEYVEPSSWSRHALVHRVASEYENFKPNAYHSAYKCTDGFTYSQGVIKIVRKQLNIYHFFTEEAHTGTEKQPQAVSRKHRTEWYLFYISVTISRLTVEKHDENESKGYNSLDMFLQLRLIESRWVRIRERSTAFSGVTWFLKKLKTARCNQRL